MNTTPRTRRVGFILIIWLIGFGLPYYLLLKAAGEQAVAPALLRTIALWGGLGVSLSIGIFTLSLIISVRDFRQWISSALFLALSAVCSVLFVAAIVGHGTTTSLAFTAHLGIGLIILFATLIIGSQFVLPTRTNEERTAVIRRLLGFLVGERGPITFLRNGEVIEAHDERSRSGPGVLLIDYASAAVLRTDVKFTRSVGPGLVLTESGERIEKSVDLRRQIRSVEGFIPPTGKAAPLDSVNSLAITKDGIPVSTDISVQFILDPGEHVALHEGRIARRAPYPWKPNAVEKAVYGHVYGEGEDLPWTELPLRLTIDLWREIVKEKSLKELIGIDTNGDQPLQIVGAEIYRRLTGPEGDPQEDAGSSETSNHREWKIIQSRGIRVLSVELSYLYLPQDVRREQMEGWRHDWASDIQNALAGAQDKAARATHEGETEANELLFEHLTGILYEQIRNTPTLSRQDTVRCLLKGAVDLCTQNEVIEDSPSLKENLLDIARDLAALDKDCRERSEHSEQGGEA